MSDKKKFEFSPDQKRAIAARGNIIISAGAGSGKTAVMIQNVVDRILGAGDGKCVPLSEMLVVTFTKASAADMRIKLSEELLARKTAASQAGDNKTVELIKEAESDMPVSDIGTLHSFCYRLILNHFYAAEVDPSAAIADEGEASLMLFSAVRSAVKAAIDGGDPAFSTVYDMLTKKRSGTAIEDKLVKIVEFALSMPDPDKYLGGAKPDSEYFSLIDDIVEKRSEVLVEEIEKLKEKILAANVVELKDAIYELAPYLYGQISEVRKTSMKKTSPNSDVNDEYKALKNRIKDHRDFVAEVEAAKRVDSSVYSNALLAVARDALARYDEKKRARAVLDYSDLEHGALKALRNDECKKELAARLKCVYIDEFQDVNPLQAEIAAELGKFAVRFLVGDVKQSIYGFRRCNPVHFKNARVDPAFENVLLTGNYRSSAPVIDFVNSVFTGMMTPDFGGVDYAEEKLVCKRDAVGETSFVLVNAEQGAVTVARKKADDGAIDKVLESPEVASEAAATAETPDEEEGERVYSVKNAGSAERYDVEAAFVADALEKYLTAHPQDSAAVLVRSVRSAFCADLARLLGKRGVPFRIGRNAPLKECPEAVMLLDILRCADNRYDDLALYTAMRSPMGGFSDAELLEISEVGARAAKSKGEKPERKKYYPFWQKVKNYKGDYDKRLKAFNKLLEDVVAKSRVADAADTLGYITSRIDYFRYVYENFPSGGAENVEALIALAASRQCDPHAFLDYCDRTDVELGAAAERSAVTITTIHSSKGLEYDYVIVAETAKSFNFKDARSAVIVSDEGVAIKFPDADEHKLVESVPHILAKLRGEATVVEEEMRLFYVALTRAMKSLTVCGKRKTQKSDEKQKDKYTRYIDFMRAVPCAVVDQPASIEPAVSAAVVFDVTEEQLDKIKAHSAPIPVSHRPIKTCVTAIAESVETDDYTAYAPVMFVDDERPIGPQPRLKKSEKTETQSGEKIRLRGTAYHKAMELIDFDKPDIDAVAGACENFDTVTPDEILVAAAKMRELTRNSAYAFKEQYFIVDVPLSVATGERKDGSELLQGVIDLLIVDGDGNATIVDYKTTSPEGLMSAAYKKQLELYAYAVEHSTTFKVVRKCLYSFVLGDLIEL